MQQGPSSGEQPHAQLLMDSSHAEINEMLPSDGPLVPQPGAVHCFWALMTYGDLRFIYLSNSVQTAVNSKYERLLGRSFFDFIHPDEATLARKDLNAFMDVHNLYGSVTRCRFRNICPDWTLFQKQLREQQQQQQHEKHVSDSGSSNERNSAATLNCNGQTDLSQGSSADTANGQSHNPDAAKSCEQTSPNSEMDDYMILDVVMNVVSDQVVLGFFHIDGQGPFKGFWSGKRCGETKDSLNVLASEILRHLRASTASIPASPPSPLQQHERTAASKDTKRILQLYDTEKRSLLLTWPEPSADDNPADATKMVYNPEFYTHIVQSHHIPADALANTTCLKRFCSKHAISGQGYPQETQPIFQIESVFIPYGHIIFACFQTTPAPSSLRSSSLAPPLSLSAFGTGALQPLSESSYMNVSSAAAAASSRPPKSATAHGSSAGSNPPLVIPSLPSLSPFLRHAVPSPTHSGSGGGGGGGPIPSSPLSGSNNHFRPYPKPSSHQSGNVGSNSSSPLLDQPSKLGLSETDRLSSLSTWHASTPHPAMAAIVGHSLASPTYYRGNDNNSNNNNNTAVPSASSTERRLPFPAEHTYSRERTVSSSALDQSLSAAAAAAASAGGVKTEPADTPRSRARTASSPTFSNGSIKLQNNGSVFLSNKSGSRHPAHDAAIRIKTAPIPGTSSGGGGNRRRESSSESTEDSQHSGKSKNGDGESVVSTYSCSNGGLVIRISQEEKTCESCHTTNSPEWRRGPSGKKNLCNACGLRYSRSVARQNRQAQKLAEGKVGGGGAGAGAAGAKVKGPKKPKGVSKPSVTSTTTTTTAATSSTTKPLAMNMGSLPQHDMGPVGHQQHMASSSTSPPLSISPAHSLPHTTDPRQAYAAATAAAAAVTLGESSPYSQHHHPPSGNLYVCP